jgi:methionine sulfoxide reductase catalytic subunit
MGASAGHAPGKLSPLVGGPSRVSGANTMEKITSYADASSYNNYYEFGTDKADPAKYAHTLPLKPWTVEIEGLVKSAFIACAAWRAGPW